MFKAFTRISNEFATYNRYSKLLMMRNKNPADELNQPTGQNIIFFPCGFFFLSFFLFCSSPNLSHRRLDVCHTSTHGVALVRI